MSDTAPPKPRQAARKSSYKAASPRGPKTEETEDSLIDECKRMQERLTREAAELRVRQAAQEKAVAEFQKMRKSDDEGSAEASRKAKEKVYLEEMEKKKREKRELEVRAFARVMHDHNAMRIRLHLIALACADGACSHSNVRVCVCTVHAPR